MTLKQQIELELDDANLEAMEIAVRNEFPWLTLDSEVSEEIVNSVSDILADYAK